MKYKQYEGVIINRRAVKDGDRFLTIFTKSLGKISIYARGVRSIKSKRLASLDLYNRIKFQAIQNQQRLTLTQVELLNSYHQGKYKLGDISRLFIMGELIDAFLPENDPNLEVYRLLVTALDNLADFDTPQYLIRFKQKLLQILGYGQVQPANLDNYIASLLDKPLTSTLSLW